MDASQRTELNYLQMDLQAEMSHSRQYKALLALAMVVTLLVYLFFSGHLKLGNPLYWGEYFNHGEATIAAFFFMFASVILLGVFLAWVKHFAYTHFTTYRAIAGVMITVIGLALLAEMFASLEDQKAKADIQLANNPAYQQSVTYNPLATVSAPSGTALADTQGQLAKTRQYLATCKKTCSLQRAKVAELEAKANALQASDKAQLDAQAKVAQTAMQANYARQDKLKADAHNDFIVGVAKVYAWLFGDGTESAYVSFISWGNITLMMLIAVGFERLHAFLIEAGRNIKANIRGLEQRIAQIRDGANPLADAKHLPPVGEPLFNWQRNYLHDWVTPEARDPANRTAPAMAKAKAAPDSQYADSRIGFTAGRAQAVPTAPMQPAQEPHANRSSSARFTPDMDAAATPTSTSTTYRQELRSGSKLFSDQPLDASARPANQKSGGTGLQNPVLGNAEEHYQLPLDPQENNLSAPSRHPQAGGSDNLKLEGISIKPQAKAVQVPDGLYEAWVRAVNAGDCLPSLKGSWHWIQKRIAGTQRVKASATNLEIGKIAQAFFLRAVKDGYAAINTKYTSPRCGLPKYLWNK